jgi:hypothetical protein
MILKFIIAAVMLIIFFGMWAWFWNYAGRIEREERRRKKAQKLVFEEQMRWMCRTGRLPSDEFSKQVFMREYNKLNKWWRFWE